MKISRLKVSNREGVRLEGKRQLESNEMVGG